MIVEVFWAFFGGLFSFLSPCVLPLAPPYLAYMAGTTIDRISSERRKIDLALRRRVFVSSICFVLGLAAIFTSLGLGAATAGNFLLSNKATFSVAAGYFIAGFGLHFIGFRHGLRVLAATLAVFGLWMAVDFDEVLNGLPQVAILAGLCAGFWFVWRATGIDGIPILNREARFKGPAQTGSLFASFLMGAAFAFGWTPCIGPFLAAILAIAAGGGKLEGGILLGFYALGLGVPFLVAAWYIGPFLNWAHGVRRHARLVEVAMGGMLVLTGWMLITGTLERMANFLIELFPVLARVG